MSAASDQPMWTNRIGKEPPAWVKAHLVGDREPNGTYLLRTERGNARVHVGNVVMERNGKAWTCHLSEAPKFLRELIEGEQGFAHLNKEARAQRGVMGSVAESEAEVADRADDTDEITARIAAAAAKPKTQIEVSRAAARAARAGSSSRPPAAPPAPAPTPPANERPPIIDAPLGSRPSIEWVLVADLRVDDSYQRDIANGPSRTLIATIARSWDWRMCLPLLVSRREAGMFVIDGQHRCAAAAARGDIDQLPCMIARYASPAEEAEMFVRMNRARRQMNRLDDFHAAQVSGDPDSIAIARLVTSAGFTVARKTGSATWVPGEVAFTSAIRTIRRKHGEVVCARALGMMAEVFAGQRLTAGSSIFTALCRIMVSPPPAFSAGRLLVALGTFDMRGWSELLTKSKGGDDRAQRIRESLLMAYDDAGKGLLA